MKVTVIGDNGYSAYSACHYLANEAGIVDKAELAVARAPHMTGHDPEFDLPKDIPISAVPIIGEPAFRPMTFNDRLGGRPTANAMRGLKYIGKRPNETGGTYFEMNWERGISEAELIEDLHRSERVYLVYWNRSVGAHTARRFRDWLVQQGVECAPTFCAYEDMSDPKSYEKAVLAPADGRTIDEQSVPWSIKRYFDYNYLVNSTSVMRLTSMRAIGRDVGKSLSSESLQALFHLRERSGVAKETFLEDLMEWQGTGRYPVPGRIFWGDVMLKMFEQEAIAVVTKEGKVEITEDGATLLAAMHPDCRDPDQKQRLAQWQERPEDEARERIEQYIRTFFGKQARFLKDQDVVTPIR